MFIKFPIIRPWSSPYSLWNARSAIKKLMPMHKQACYLHWEQPRKSLSRIRGNDHVGNSSSFININFYKSTFTKLKFMVNDYRWGNETTYFISEEVDHERHIHIIWTCFRGCFAVTILGLTLKFIMWMAVPYQLAILMVWQAQDKSGTRCLRGGGAV